MIRGANTHRLREVGKVVLPFPVQDHGCRTFTCKSYDRRGEARQALVRVLDCQPWAGALTRREAFEGKTRALGWSERLLKEIRNG